MARKIVRQWCAGCLPIAAIAALSVAPSLSETAVAAVTVVSRANCINNESITWDPLQTTYPWMYAQSTHFNWVTNTTHVISVDTYNDNAAKAIHWGEGNEPIDRPWVVDGVHIWEMPFTGIWHSSQSYAYSCPTGGT